MHQTASGLLSASLGAALWAVSIAWGAYLLYSFGWLPGVTQLQVAGNAWAAGAVTLASGLLSVLWSSAGIWRWLGERVRGQNMKRSP
jgi:hypothetical protein